MIGAYIFVRALDMATQQRDSKGVIQFFCVLLIIVDAFCVLGLIATGASVSSIR
jgi:hypothetical protein